jgi:chromate reductase
MQVLGIVGSLRAGSYNRGLLAAARELAPEGMEIVEHDIAGLPFYDAGLEAGGDPEPVAAFKRAIAEADAILIATPEYNRSVPGALKNAIDWASRPPLGSPLAGKRVGVMGASTGMSGTIHAQAHLLQALECTRASVLDGHRVLVPLAYEHFDEDGRLTSPEVRDAIRGLLGALDAEGAAEDVPQRALVAG